MQRWTFLRKFDIIIFIIRLFQLERRFYRRLWIVCVDYFFVRKLKKFLLKGNSGKYFYDTIDVEFQQKQTQLMENCFSV